jgi:hypothetical protein
VQGEIERSERERQKSEREAIEGEMRDKETGRLVASLSTGCGRFQLERFKTSAESASESEREGDREESERVRDARVNKTVSSEDDKQCMMMEGRKKNNIVLH